MKELLFIRGHNTFLIDKNSRDIYHSFKTFCDNNDMHITYVNYNTNDDICKVYENVCDLIRYKSFDFIVGHSVGGCLLMRYIFDRDLSRFLFKGRSRPDRVSTVFETRPRHLDDGRVLVKRVDP